MFVIFCSKCSYLDPRLDKLKKLKRRKRRKRPSSYAVGEIAASSSSSYIVRPTYSVTELIVTCSYPIVCPSTSLFARSSLNPHRSLSRTPLQQTNKQTKNRQECQQLNEQSRRSFLIFTDFFFSFSLFLNRFFFWGGVSMELIVFTFN